MMHAVDVYQLCAINSRNIMTTDSRHDQHKSADHDPTKGCNSALQIPAH